MMALTLVVANKAYSSWSLRPWILMTHFGVPFEDIVIPLEEPDTKAAIARYSPTGKCPVLHDGEASVWESIAIIDYLAELFPDKPIWPKEKRARAHARSIAAEMHAGFVPLRVHCPTNFRRKVSARALTPEVAADVARIEAIWSGAREKFGAGGPFLFGAFTAADAMYAPVVNRFHIYDVPVKQGSRAYMDAVMALPAWKAWIEGAAAEPWRIAKYEAI
jgi:glutathione S-transferase